MNMSGVALKDAKRIESVQFHQNYSYRYLRLLKKQKGKIETFSPEQWCGMVDCVIVGKEMVFTFRDGMEVAV